MKPIMRSASFFMTKEKGIVSRLVQHVYGKREILEDTSPDIQWKAEDLEFDPLVCQKSGRDAHELASNLMDDPWTKSLKHL